MIKKTYKYVDFNGNEREEDFYFHLSESEIVTMDMSINGGLIEKIKRITQTQDTAELIKIFQELIFKSYGEKSLDGKRFVKSEELSTAFSQTEAYNMLFMELAKDADAAAKWINGILPADVQKQLQQQNSIG